MKATDTDIISNFQVRQYSSQNELEWNDFVSKSKNATFLFDRNFMEYHKERFEDYSLMVFKDEKLIALLPANKVGDTIHSHQGLTYGGLLLLEGSKFNDVAALFDAVLGYLQQEGFKILNIKMVPKFYTEQESNEIAYLLTRKNAELYKRDIEMVIDLAQPIKFHKTKLKHYKKTGQLKLKIEKTGDQFGFWNGVLQPRLENKHNAKPVHSLEEIQRLQNRFPSHIHQFNILHNDEILAGITIFETETVVKSQYGATTEKGEQLRALEYLFIHLIEKYRLEGKKFFSMGTVSTDNEKGYNEGLLKQKEELGCSVYLQDFYKLELI